MVVGCAMAARSSALDARCSGAYQTVTESGSLIPDKSPPLLFSKYYANKTILSEATHGL